MVSLKENRLLSYKAIFVLLLFCSIFIPQKLISQSTKDISKSIRILNYTAYLSDNTISSKGLTNTLELNNYNFTNYFTFSLLTFGKENKFISARNNYNRFYNNNIKLKTSLAYVKGSTLKEDTVRLYWNPKKKSWTEEVINSRFPPRDILNSSTINDRFFVAGLGLHSYNKIVNPGIDGYFIKNSGDRHDQNVQVSLIMELFKKRKVSAFFHYDFIHNKNYAQNNSDRLFFTEAEISASLYPFTFSVNAGFGKSIFRYALLDNGYLEYTPVLLKYIYGFNTTLNFPSWGGLFLNISQSGYHLPGNISYTSFYGGLKLTLKKY